MKPGSIGDPNFYLGAELRPIELPDGVTAWAMSSSKYIQAAVNNIKDYLAKNYPGQITKACHCSSPCQLFARVGPDA